MIPQETVDLILDTAQIADVISDYVTLKRRGANYVACCPFHNEKTPSFYVSPSKGIYKCFGCGKAGTAVGFVMEQEHCSYTEALRYLARKYNIEIREEQESAEDIALRQRNESLLLVSEEAQRFFRAQLDEPEGQAVARVYYQSRGIEPQTIDKFGLGWAPSSRTSFVDYALAKGYKPEYLLGAGLAVQSEDGSLRDKFRERVMFPIHSLSGRVIAYSGRTLRSDNPAKYVNSPETDIYIKSRNLLGIYFAKSEISRLDKCILVEGNIDMVMMHQLGICNVVASCGTSLTIEQIRLIHKFTDNLTIMYDGDSAGIHAALRGITMVLSEGMNVKIVMMPEGDDPDSFSRRHTLEEVQRFIETSEKDFIAFKTDLLLSEAAGDPLKKANLINDIADTIAHIPDAVKRSVYVEHTAASFGIEAQILFERIRTTRIKLQEELIKDVRRQEKSAEMQAQQPAQVQPQVQSQPVQSGWPEENKSLAIVEKELLHFMLNYGREVLEFETDSEFYDQEFQPSVTDFIREALECDDCCFANSVYARLYDLYIALYDQGLAQEEAVTKLLNSQDRQVAELCAHICTEQHQLTIKKFKDALTTTSSWLTSYVPRTILRYTEKRVEEHIKKLTRALAQASIEEQEDIMKQMVLLQNALQRIRVKSGREKQS